MIYEGVYIPDELIKNQSMIWIYKATLILYHFSLNLEWSSQ